MATITKQHSDFWLDKDLFNDDAPEAERLDINRIARLAAVRRAVTNFVSILSGKNVPVQYSSGKNSYTDGETVVISAEEDTSKFDSMVGLALHEGSHILLSDFNFLKNITLINNNLNSHHSPVYFQGHQVDNVLNHIFPESLKKILGKTPVYGYNYDPMWDNLPYWKNASRMLSHLKDIMNILEDRRIDLWVYQNAQGYRPYYDALYNKYFFTAEIGKNLRFNPEWREITIENYINRLLLCIHPASDSDAMPGLRKLIDMLDLSTIDRVAPETNPIYLHKVPTFDECPRLWQDACTIYAHILSFTGLALQQKTAPQPQPSSLEDILNNMFGDDSGLPNLDNAPNMVPVPVEQDTKGKGKKQTLVPGKFNGKKANKELSELQKVMNGEVKKKALKKTEKEAVDALDTADAKMVDIKGDGIKSCKCMVTRKLTKALLDQDWFIFGRRWPNSRIDDAIAAGRRMGALLHHRLQVRNDPMMTKQTRLPHGGLDRRLLAQLGMEITSVFQKSRVDSHKPVILHLSLDASGSMNGLKWEKVVTVATAVAYLSSKMQNVDCVISIRGGNDLPIVSILFDSRKDQFQTFTQMFKNIAPSGSTPEGLAFKATLDLIMENADTHDVYFINFSDGEPAFSWSERVGKHLTYTNYGGEFAALHTKKQIMTMRAAGVKILSYFISEGTYPISPIVKSRFNIMYGEDASYVDIKNAGEVLRTLNALLVKRGT